MFDAILFDLDGTLLDIDMNEFIPRYFNKMLLMAADLGIIEAQEMIKQIYKSTDIMIADDNHELTNEEVFTQDFTQKFKFLSFNKVQKFLEHFYSEGFPQLREHTKPFTGVPEMMEKVFKRDFKIAIATNPVFPRSAIIERLKWAGVNQFDYNLITSYEVMHFCKPNPDYYLEIAKSIGVDPKKCLMVGNDIGEDLIAGKVGMKTFLVEDRLIDKGIDLKPDWRGDLTFLFDFFEQI